MRPQGGAKNKGKGSLMDIPQKAAPKQEPFMATDTIMNTLLLVESHKVRSADGSRT